MKNPVLYWMQAAQRTEWNPALSHAARQAHLEDRPLQVVFVMTDRVPDATIRPYIFMLEGLAETFQALRRRGIGADAIVADRERGDPGYVVSLWARQIRACRIVADTGELKFQREWRQTLERECQKNGIPVELVDSNYIVPPAVVSDHQEWSAATIRRKIMQKIDPWFEEARASQGRWSALPPFSIETFDAASNAQAIGVRSFDPEIQSEARSTLDQLQEINRSVAPLSEMYSIQGGASHGVATLKRFIASELDEYGEKKADKTLGAQSTLSAWLHFGMLSPAQILDDIFDYLGDSENSPKKQDSLFSGLELRHPTVAAFVEQLVVRRELAANFCRFNHLYDKWEGLPNWSRATLLKHASDTRQWRYSALELETAETHDPYWNAAQQQLRRSGFIHNHMRMYWGKKILEWSKTPEEAFYTAISLNDRWALDGRDANGYAGVAWCFGTHDRPWTERPIFGMVRYMNDKGLERKFKMAPYLEKWLS